MMGARGRLGRLWATGAALLASAQPALAADWWTITSRPNFHVDTDADSVTCKADICSAWERLTTPGKAVRVLVQFDCARRLMRSLTQTYDRGAPAGSPATVKLSANWTPIRAETMGSEALLFVCSVREKHPSDRLSVMSIEGYWFARAGSDALAGENRPEKAEPPPAPEPQPIRSPPPPAAKPPAQVAQAAPRPAPPVAPKAVQLRPVARAPAPPPAAVAPSQNRPVAPRATTAAPSATPGGIEVQITAGSQAASRAALAALVQAQPALVAGHPTDVRRKPGAGEIYRAVIGGFASRAAAQDFCRKLTASGRACFVRPPGG